MTKKDIQMLVQLREFARQNFDSVEGKGNPMAMMRSQDVAWTLSSIVKSLDEVLKEHVTIK
jgi:hypothetical protein